MPPHPVILLLTATVILISSLSVVSVPAVHARPEQADLRLPTLDADEAAWIGQRIFANECNLKLSCLTSWNAGENFPSLGIGHFIWYRSSQSEPFAESFPALLAFYRQEGIALPDWLEKADGALWPDREAFLADLDSPRLAGLRQFLHDTMDVQVRFIINRLHESLPKLTAASENPEVIATRFHQVAASDSPLGMYALIDYINFKGEGTATSERYQDQGWGLLQVLEHMSGAAPAPLMEQFAASAAFVLERRIENAPPGRNESRWRAGWLKRVDTYRPQDTRHAPFAPAR